MCVWLLGLTTMLFLIAEIHRRGAVFFWWCHLKYREQRTKRDAVWDARTLCAHYILAYLRYFNIWEYHSCFSPHFRWLFFFVAGWILWSPPLEPTSTTMRPSSPSTGRVGTTPGLATWIRWQRWERWERWENPIFFLGFTKRQIFSSDLQHPTTSTTIQSQTLSHIDSSHIAPVRFGQSKPQLLFHPWDACILRLHPWSFIYLPRWRRCLENCVLLLTQMFGFKRLMVVGKQEPHNSKRQATCLLQIS